MVTAEQTKNGYAKLWDEMTVTKETSAQGIARRIIANKPAYKKIETDTGVPWIMAATIHMRESDFDFRTHMHNGDPLSDYTHHVPAGRPKVGHPPPFTFEESTDDAFTMPGKQFDKLFADPAHQNIETILFATEGYNGWGYLKRGNSPYIWSWSSEYHGGKYVSDGVYDPNHWDEQPGCATIMKVLGELDVDAKRWIERRVDDVGKAPAIVVKNGTRKERTATGIGAGATAGAATGTIQQPATPGGKVAVTFVSVAIGIIGLAVALVAGVLLYQKTKAIKDRWRGVSAT